MLGKNLDVGLVSAKNRYHKCVLWIRINGWILKLFLTFLMYASAYCCVSRKKSEVGTDFLINMSMWLTLSDWVTGNSQ